jgi:hypothetical protein
MCVCVRDACLLLWMRCVDVCMCTHDR